jgi:RND family efflux transporter MFP subunit
MSGVELKANDIGTLAGTRRVSLASALRILPILATVIAVAVAGFAGWQAWRVYMGSPWTRDGAVRAYVVKIATQVPGEIVQLPIADNQFVHKGDLLMLIDPTNYAIAVRQAQAAVEQAKAVADNAQAEMERREKLNDIAVAPEERQTYISRAASAQASYQSALASLDEARANLRRTRIRSPVNGYVTNLSAQLGDYATVGQRQISVINADSYWVDAYFEETVVGLIREGDAATIKLMGYAPVLRGRVQGLARGIDVRNADPDAAGLASVNPIFTFVRLAQRVPVRIHLEEVPKEVKLFAGMTATVQIERRDPPQVPGSTPASLPLSQAPAPADPGALAQASPTPSVDKTPAPVAPSAQAAAVKASAAPSQTLGGTSSAAPSAQAAEAAAAAASAASADLKTLEQQIAPSPAAAGAAGAAPYVDAGRAANADEMPPSEYLGHTVDLFAGDLGATPSPRRSSHESLRRRGHAGWRHHDY